MQRRFEYHIRLCFLMIPKARESGGVNCGLCAEPTRIAREAEIDYQLHFDFHPVRDARRAS